MRHRQVDRARLDTLGERGGPSRQPYARLGPAHDLDLLPREAHAAPERLADGLLPGEPARVALSRTRARVAVLPLGVGEAPLAKPWAGERALDALDLDDVDADLHGAQPPEMSSSSNAGKCPSDETTISGAVSADSSASGR